MIYIFMVISFSLPHASIIAVFTNRTTFQVSWRVRLEDSNYVKYVYATKISYQRKRRDNSNFFSDRFGRIIIMRKYINHYLSDHLKICY